MARAATRTEARRPTRTAGRRPLTGSEKGSQPSQRMSRKSASHRPTRANHGRVTIWTTATASSCGCGDPRYAPIRETYTPAQAMQTPSATESQPSTALPDRPNARPAAIAAAGRQQIRARAARPRIGLSSYMLRPAGKAWIATEVTADAATRAAATTAESRRPLSASPTATSSISKAVTETASPIGIEYGAPSQPNSLSGRGPSEWLRWVRAISSPRTPA